MYVTSQFYLESFFVKSKKSSKQQKCLRSIKKAIDFLCSKENINKDNKFSLYPSFLLFVRYVTLYDVGRQTFFNFEGLSLIIDFTWRCKYLDISCTDL